jgi:predicted permease
VGVLPDEAEFPNSPDAWVAIRDVRDARVFGVLAPGRTVEVAGAQLAAASAQYEAENRAATPLRLDLVPFAEALSRGLDVLMASLVFALVLVVLVIAANVGNLVLARTLSRTTELAIRASLGATRTRLVGQIAAEALVLGAIASAAGVLASQEALRWARLTLTDMPFWVDLTAGPWTMAFVVGVTLLTTAVAGAWPALRATRADTARTMAAGSGRTSIGFGRFSTAVIAAQVALSIGALHAALVVAHGVAGYMADVPLPAQWQVVTAKVNAPDTVGTRAAYSAVLDALQRRPDVAAAGLATSLPRLSPPTVVTTVRAGASGAGSERRAAPSVAVSRGFLESLGATPVRGRLFIAGDFEPDAPPVAIVNEPFVAKFLAGADPVGWQLAAIDEQTGAPGPWREVVGVVPDLGLSAGDAAYAAGFYVPMGDESFTYLSVATRGDVAPFVDGLRTMVADVEPRLTIREVMPLHEVGAEDRAVFAGIGTAIMALGGVALLLSVLGVYAMLSFSVTRRQRELAIRTALGATPRHLLGSLVGRTLLPLSLGVLAGPLLGAGLVALRGIFAFRLPAEAGPWAAPALGALVLIAGLIAAWVPARRSLQVTTSDALRAD